MYKNRFVHILIVAVLIAPFTAPAQQQPNLVSVSKFADSLLSRWKESTPGIVLTMSRGGKIIYDQAAGMADLEHDILVTDQTLFEAGSVSKQFTSTAILMLVDEGKISLDTPVRAYLPKLPDYGSLLTVRHLLTHTSGLRDWGEVAALGGWPRGTRTYTQDHAREIIFRQQLLNFKPGTQYSYSNSNFTLLATLVELISGQSLAAFTRERIFKPVGMNDTNWREDFRAIVEGRAIAYSYNAAEKEYLLDMPFEYTHGHAGLLTTTRDMLKWNDWWKANKFGGALAKLRLTQGVLTSGQKIEYALGGVFVKHNDGLREVSHSGATAGYRAWLAYYPDYDLSVACLSNDGSASLGSMVGQIIDLYSGKSNARAASQSLSAEQFGGWAGLYKSVRGYNMLELEVKDKGLYMKTGAEVRRLNGDTLTTGSRKMLFRGKNTFLSIIGQDTLTYVKVAKYSPSSKDLQSFTGLYRSDEAEAELNIELSDRGTLRVFRKPATRISLQPIYKDAFYMGSSIILEFTRDAGKEITGMRATSSRAENIEFRKLK